MRLLNACFIAPLVAAWAGAAGANDSIAELTTGGLVLKDSAGIEMVSEDLRISPRAVEVDYVFRNRTDRDISATVAFPMPDVGDPGGDMSAIPAEGDNFLDFTVVQDGQKISPTLTARAETVTGDVTAELQAQGVPVIPLGAAVETALERLPEAVARDWQRREIIEIVEMDAGQGLRPVRLPRWTASSSWHWQTTFPAGAEVRVSHRYRPSLGGSAGLNFIDYDRMRVGGDLAGDYRRRFCMDAAFEKAVNKRLAAAGTGMVPMEWRLAYVLGTGGNWAGGRIGRFTLTVDKGLPDALVSFCGTDVEKIGPTRFRMTAQDFAPPERLDILIVTPPGAMLAD